jgi:GT2 family glycosyltransferase
MHFLGGLRTQAGTAACYDLVLRAVSAGLGIQRITEVLAAYPGARLGTDVRERRAVLQAWLEESAAPFEIAEGRVPGTLQLQRRFSTFPNVTLIIPTRQGLYEDQPTGLPMVINLIDSIVRTDWPMDKIQVLVGDAIADDSIYVGRNWPFAFRRIVTGSPDNAKFNYAAKANVLWRAAETEQIVLMNDDVLVQSPAWLKALLTFSMQENVGVAGARLLYPNGTIQHAGIPGGVFDLCTHAWIGLEPAAPTYQNWALVHREWSMVTGAVMATRRSTLEVVNGFDERFRLDFNDVDLCLRLRMLGHQIIYTPFAELTHHEKGSRADFVSSATELALFRKRWGEFLENDPAYHPRLTRKSTVVGPTEQRGGWWLPVFEAASRVHGGLPATPQAATPQGRVEHFESGGSDRDGQVVGIAGFSLAESAECHLKSRVAVVYLARGADEDWSSSVQRFSRSYREFSAGRDHALYVLYKGFESDAEMLEVSEHFSGTSTRPIHLTDDALDIGAYIAAAGMIDEEYICFMNTHAEVLAPDWLDKLADHLERPGIGMVGATGSFETRPGFPDFPNRHLRTNAFMIGRDLFLSLASDAVIRDKEDAYLVEHGPDSLTQRVLALGLKVLVVGRNGRGYSPQWWPCSDTYRQGSQTNLLIADNQTRTYATASSDTQRRLLDLAWGSYLDPSEALPTQKSRRLAG